MKILSRVFTLILLASSCLQAQVTSGRKDDIVLANSNGAARIVSGAQVKVCQNNATGVPCTATIAIFNDPALTQPLLNPTNADANGNYHFYTSPQKVQIQISAIGQATAVYNDVTIPNDPLNPVFQNVTILGTCTGPGCSAGSILSTVNTFTANNTFSANMNATGGGNLSGIFTGNPVYTGSVIFANINSVIYMGSSKYPLTDLGIRQAIVDSVAASGGTGGYVALNPGHYLLSNGGNILVDAPVEIIGAGKATWLDNATLTSTQDVFVINPTSDGNLIRFSDFMICCTATAGRYAFHYNGATANITNTSVERVLVNAMGQNSVNPFTVVYAEGTSLSQGTPNVSTFSHDIFIGGMIFTNAGDTLRIEDSQLSFVGKIDVQFQSGGVSSFILQRNNITLPGGIHIGGTSSTGGVGAIGCLIDMNELETLSANGIQPAFTGSNGSFVDLDGTASSPDVNCVVSNNSFQIVNGIVANSVRTNWAISTNIYANRFGLGVSPSHDIFATANAVNTIVGTNVWALTSPFIVSNPASTGNIYAANPYTISLNAQIQGPTVLNAGRQGHALDAGLATLDEAGVIRPLLTAENTAGSINMYGYHGTCLLQGVIGATYICDGNGVSGDISLGVSTTFLPAVVTTTGITVAGLYFKEISAPVPATTGADLCYGDSTAHLPRCSYNNANFHGLRTTELGTCTMVAGTCTVTWAAGFVSTPLCVVTWNGTGTLTGIVKGVPSTTNCVVTSSVGTDTGVMQVLGTANPN